MARLTKTNSSDDDDEFPDVNTLLKQGPTRRIKAATLKPAAPSCSPEKPSLSPTRKVRRLGGTRTQDLDNPLLQRWDTGESDGIPTIASLEAHGTSARPRIASLQLRKVKMSPPASRSTSPIERVRPARARRPRISPQLVDDSDEASSDDDVSLHHRIQVLKTRKKADEKDESGIILRTQTERKTRPQRAVSEGSQASALPPKQQVCSDSEEASRSTDEEDDSVYQTAQEPDSDSSEESCSDFTPDDSPRPSPARFTNRREVEIYEDQPKESRTLKRNPKPSECATEGTRKGLGDTDLASTFSKLRLQMLDFSDDEPDTSNNKRPTTPPPSEKTTQPKGLVSPKKQALIPRTPHKANVDAFWSQDVVNEWNDKHSPRKPIFAPKASSPVKMSSAKESKKSFADRRQGVAESFLRELDEAVTQGRIGEMTASTGGVRLVWSKTLNTTAGRANWKSEVVRTKAMSARDFISAEPERRHHAFIELAEKVIDDEPRLLNTLAHEFCHLATYMVDGVTTNPHGQHFKAWGAKCSREFGARGIEVTTKHSYAIDFKYVWQCDACGAEYKRHSRSIDPARHRCGGCKGVLAQIKPVPRKASGSGNSGTGTAKLSEYQLFMKDEMKVVRAEMPGSPQKEVMRIVAERWAKKSGKDKTKTKTTTTAKGKENSVAGVDDMLGKLHHLTVEDD